MIRKLSCIIQHIVLRLREHYREKAKHEATSVNQPLVLKRPNHEGQIPMDWDEDVLQFHEAHMSTQCTTMLALCQPEPQTAALRLMAKSSR